MAASLQFRPQNRVLGMMMREVDGNLAIFLGMSNGDHEKNGHLLPEDKFDVSMGEGQKPDIFFMMNDSDDKNLVNVPIVADDNFLNLEMEKSGYKWLLKQQDDPLLPLEDAEGHDSAADKKDTSLCESVVLKSELVSDASKESASLTTTDLQRATFTNSVSSAALNGKPVLSSIQNPTSRAATSALLAMATKSSRASTPKSTATLESSVVTSRAIIPSSNATAARVRSSTPVNAKSRSSTLVATSRATSQPALRSVTPTLRTTTPSTTTSSASVSDRSSSGHKPGSTMLKTPKPSSRVSCQTVNSRPSMASEMLSLSQEAPENPKASLPTRHASASRGRSSAPVAAKVNQRQKSCSPARIRATNNGDDVNPVLIGTKMVERVVNMRKLAPPKDYDYHTLDHSKKSSQGNSGFGRSLSKKSLEMAIRHMDIGRSIPDN